MIYLKIDLHIHTDYSRDSLIRAEELPAIAKKKGLEGIAVTDHDSIGAWKTVSASAKKAGIAFIPGEEIGVSPNGKRVGEIIGLFMTDFVSGKGRRAIEVIDSLKSQGALVVLPHPFDSHRRIFSEDELQELAVKVDAVEVFNSHTLSKEFNKKAFEFAQEFGLPCVAGSDAHNKWEVGHAFTEANVKDLAGFKKAIISGKTIPSGKPAPLYLRPLSALAKLRSKVFGKRH